MTPGHRDRPGQNGTDVGLSRSTDQPGQTGTQPGLSGTSPGPNPTGTHPVTLSLRESPGCPGWVLPVPDSKASQTGTGTGEVDEAGPGQTGTGTGSTGTGDGAGASTDRDMVVAAMTDAIAVEVGRGNVWLAARMRSLRSSWLWALEQDRVHREGARRLARALEREGGSPELEDARAGRVPLSGHAVALELEADRAGRVLP